MRPQAYPTPSPRTVRPQSTWAKRSHCAVVPAAEAAMGRYRAAGLRTGRGGAVPQAGSTGPAAVAWFRASGSKPGYLNRRARRQLAQP